MLVVDIVGSKMMTFGPKSGAAAPGFVLAPQPGLVVQLGAHDVGLVVAPPVPAAPAALLLPPPTLLPLPPTLLPLAPALGKAVAPPLLAPETFPEPALLRAPPALLPALLPPPVPAISSGGDDDDDEQPSAVTRRSELSVVREKRAWFIAIEPPKSKLRATFF